MRAVLFFAIASAALAAPPDPADVVRKSIELDQANWMRMKDYTWIARETTRHLDSDGHLKSTEGEAWETTILFGEPYRKMLERNGKPLSADEQRREQKKIDELTAKLDRETPAERDRRLAEYMRQREKDREFFREIPDAFDFTLEGAETIDGRDTWVIAARPKPGYRARHSDAKAFARIEGRIWIDQREFQWVRIEARTLGTISAGWFLARLNPGATLRFEQTRINDEIWLPSREVLSGSGRLALLKKLSERQEITWSNYRKFQVDSKIVSTR
jgi:hypothetical protein